MRIGNTPIYEQFIGDTPIKNIWLGNTKVWTYTYDYQINDIELRYSDGGTYVKCDGSNYAYVECSLSKYKGTYLDSIHTKYMNVTFTYENMAKHIKNDGTNKLYFNIDECGTEDMSNFSNPFTTSIIPYLYGISGETLYIQIEPNVIESVQHNGYKNEGWTILGDAYISPYMSQFSVGYSSDILETNYYSSGEYKDVATPVTSYLYDENRNLLASGTSDTNYYYQTTEVNNNAYPILFSYIISQSPNSSTGYDIEFDIFQKTKNSYETPLALFDYHTRCYNEYYAYGSSYIKLVNDAHTPDTQYSYVCSTQELTISIKNGIITIDGITSSMTDSEWIDITAWVPLTEEQIEAGEELVKETITINFEYS